VIIKNEGGGAVAEGFCLGTGGGNSPINLSHYHKITVAEGTGDLAGKMVVTLGAAQATEGSANFNIADTQVYRDGVAAARAGVWLYYADAAGSDHQGNLAAGRYVCLGWDDEEGNRVYTDATWKVPEGTTALTGAWASGVYTVTASPQGETDLTALSGSGHWGNADNNEEPTTYYFSLKATRNGAATLYDTGYSTMIPAAGKLQEKTFDSNGTKTPDAGYFGFSKVTVNVSHNLTIRAGNLDGSDPGYATLFTAHSTDRGYRTITVSCGGQTIRRKILFTA
jgi:hypothetical protein